MKRPLENKWIWLLLAAWLMAIPGSPLSAANNREAENKATQDNNSTSEKLPVEMKCKLRGHEVYPGDEIILTVRFISSKQFGAEVLGSLDLGKFELKKRDKTRGKTDSGFEMVHRFVLVNFEPGTYEVPQITFVIKQGGKQEERRSDAIKVTVKSLLQEEARKMALQQLRDQQASKDKNVKKGQAKILTKPDPNLPTLNLPLGQATPGQIPPGHNGQKTASPANNTPAAPKVKLVPRDIKKPVPLILKDYTLAYIAAVVLALLLLVLLLLWLKRRKGKVQEEEEQVVEDTRPAHLIALEKLEELEKKQLVAKRLFKQYHQELSEILKEYFQKRYDLEDAPSLTSNELTEKLKKLYLKDLSERIVEELLSACDLVLFAKVEPDDTACHERLKQARMIIERTKEADNGIQ